MKNRRIDQERGIGCRSTLKIHEHQSDSNSNRDLNSIREALARMCLRQTAENVFLLFSLFFFFFYSNFMIQSSLLFFFRMQLTSCCGCYSLKAGTLFTGILGIVSTRVKIINIFLTFVAKYKIYYNSINSSM